MIASIAEFVSRPDWRTRLLGGYLQKWVVLGALIGVVAGLGAIAFFEAIDLSTQLLLGDIAGLAPPLPRGEGTPIVHHIGRLWLVPVVTTLGGLLSGLIVFTLAPEAEGHGTDAAIEAFHERGGKIRALIPPVKLVASAITIGSGGSAGREGPTAQIAAGFGSWISDIFGLDARDRRIAVAVGVGAGIGAIFKAPLGGAILAAEILYIRDFELEALIPGFIASVIGYSIFAAWAGWTPVFGEGLGLRFRQPETLVWYAALGVAAGVVGILYARFFYATRDFFHRRIHLPPHFKPALGGLAVGLLALAFPQVLSMGYGWIQLALEGNKVDIAVSTMAALVLLKILATSLTIGSGGSGGVFAPGLFIGGMLGGTMWWLFHDVGWMPDTPAPFVIVGMMALFGGIAKAPIAVMIMVAEMTGEFSMIVPAMIATGIAYLVTGNVRIYENQVPTRADSPAHRAEYTIPLVQLVTVGQALRTTVVTARPAQTIQEAEETMREHGLRGLPVLENGRLVGMFTATDALTARQEGKSTVREAMSTELVVAHPADSIHTVLQRMTRAGVSRLPVVERERPDRLLGIISTRDLAAVLDLEVSELAKAAGVREREVADDPLRSILVRDAMRRRVQTIEQSATVREAAERLSAAGAYAAVVVGEGGAVNGIVTIRDIERAARDHADSPVGEVASRPLVAARPWQTVAEALAQPGAEGSRQLPVIEERDGTIFAVGMLSRSDVVAAYLRARDRQARSARRARGPRREQRDVSRLEVVVRQGDFAAGRTLAELSLPREAVITSVIHDGATLIPRGHLRLEPGDRVEVLVSRGARDSVIEALQKSQ